MEVSNLPTNPRVSPKGRSAWLGGSQAALCIVLPIAGPPALAWLYMLVANPSSNNHDMTVPEMLSFMAVWGWSLWVYPHVWVYRHTESGLVDLFEYPFLWAVAEWTVIVACFIAIARDWRFRWQIVGAVVVMIFVTLLHHIAFNSYPLELAVESL